MKKLMFILLALTFWATAAHAENDSEASAPALVPGMKYRELKKIYNYKDYEPSEFPRYRPGVAGVASFFIPGLGNMVCGEVGRGFAWYGGTLLSGAACGVGMAMGMQQDDDVNLVCGTVLMCVGLASWVSLWTSSIVDAVRVAKVRNMYFDDYYKNYSIDVYPSVNYVRMPADSYPVAGLTLALKF